MGLVEFDVIPFEDIQGKWKKLGSGSFGNVYKATYLGIEVAIKEVLPSDEYDVSKYFDREWRLMREARHPNVVLYIALSRAPPTDNRIFIISEFIENGNLRQYIYDKNRPLPWRLRLSFATDIVRAMSYLHARQCIHRDLKPENLLITANGRVKVTDFGFARIVAQSAEETRRLTFCGTDSYMSPEILMGDAFGLETDVYSLGIIFCELAARKLADDDTFKRVAPGYALDVVELRLLADNAAPQDFIELAISCCQNDRFSRPTMKEVLERLGRIEAHVIQASVAKDEPHVGSIKFLGTKGKKLDFKTALATGAGPTRPANRRIPSFGMGAYVGTNSPAAHSPVMADGIVLAPPGGTGPIRRPVESTPAMPLEDPSEDEEDEELEAILAMNGVEIREEPSQGQDPNTLPPNANDSEMSWRFTGWMKEYADKIRPRASASVISQAAAPVLDASTESLLARVPLIPDNIEPQDASSTSSSAITVRPATRTTSQDALNEVEAAKPHHQREPNLNGAPSEVPMDVDAPKQDATDSTPADAEAEAPAESYFTAHTPSTFTPGEATVPAPAPVPAPATTAPAPVERVATPQKPAFPAAASPKTTPRKPTSPLPATPPRAVRNLAQVPASASLDALSPRVHRFSLMKSGAGWSPFDLLFGSTFGTGAKCDLCSKRLGWKPCLECDDCGLVAHMKCGESAPMDCEARESQKVPKAHRSPIRLPSPKSKSRPTSPKAKSPKANK